jgi:hypothetical protein
MSLIWTLIIGVVAGALAKLSMPGKDPWRPGHHHRLWRSQAPSWRPSLGGPLNGIQQVVRLDLLDLR